MNNTTSNANNNNSSTSTQGNTMNTNTPPVQLGMVANLASAIKNIINAPIELLALAAELTNGISKLSVSMIRNLPTASKQLLAATYEFFVGIMNPNATDEELATIIANGSISLSIKSAMSNAAKSGRNLSKALSNI